MFKINRELSRFEKHLELAEFDQAEIIITALIEKRPKDATLKLQAAILFFEKGDLAASQAQIQAGLEIDRDNPLLHLALGEIYYSQKDHQASIAALKIALQLCPDHPRGEYLMALNMIATNRLDQASLYFERVARQDRDFVLGRLLTLAEAHFQARQNPPG